MGGDQTSASVPAAPQGEQRKEAQAGSGRIERNLVGTAHRRPVGRTPQTIPVLPDLSSEISGVGAAENVSEDPASIGTTDGTEWDNGYSRMLH